VNSKISNKLRIMECASFSRAADGSSLSDCGIFLDLVRKYKEDKTFTYDVRDRKDFRLAGQGRVELVVMARSEVMQEFITLARTKNIEVQFQLFNYLNNE